MDLHPGEELLFQGHPSWRSTLGFYAAGIVVVIVAVLIAAVAGASTALAVAIAVCGILSRRVQQAQLSRVQNVNTSQSLPQRLLRIGSVDFDTAGTEDSDFTFSGVADPDDVVSSVDRALRATSPPD
jgi:uncharacterized membrane protein YdbT with pleckstrin-like domain